MAPVTDHVADFLAAFTIPESDRLIGQRAVVNLRNKLRRHYEESKARVAWQEDQLLSTAIYSIDEQALLLPYPVAIGCGISLKEPRFTLSFNEGDQPFLIPLALENSLDTGRKQACKQLWMSSAASELLSLKLSCRMATALLEWAVEQGIQPVDGGLVLELRHQGLSSGSSWERWALGKPRTIDECEMRSRADGWSYEYLGVEELRFIIRRGGGELIIPEATASLMELSADAQIFFSNDLIAHDGRELLSMNVRYCPETDIPQRGHRTVPTVTGHQFSQNLRAEDVLNIFPEARKHDLVVGVLRSSNTACAGNNATDEPEGFSVSIDLVEVYQVIALKKAQRVLASA